MSQAALPLPRFEPGLDELDRGLRPAFVVGEVHGSAAALLLRQLGERFRSPLLVVTARESEAENLCLDLKVLAPELSVVPLPEEGLHEARSPEARRSRSLRERALAAMREPAPRQVLVASLGALADAAGDPAAARERLRTLKPGERVDRDELRHLLFDTGYDPAALVVNPGEMSLRGDILDFFPFGAERPLRLELFDDEIESLREFDPETQRSTGDVEAVVIPRRGGRKLVQSAPEFTPLDHLATPPVVVWIDPVRVQVTIEDGTDLPGRAARLPKVARQLQSLRALELHPQYRAGCDWVLGAGPIDGCGGLQDLGRWALALPDAVHHLHLFSNTAAEGRRMTKLLRAHLPTRPRRAVHDQRGGLTEGFVWPALGLWVGNHHELLSRTRLRRVEADAAVPTRAVKEALELSPGDYVVHLTHGVGLYRGMKEHQNDGGTEDYLILEYDGGTLLYVPSSKIELLSRYIGAGGAPPKLDRIGGKSWSRKKASVAEALDDVADDLLELQAQRKTRAGHAFEPDDDLQSDFEASFPYTDTRDQVNSVEEIKRDMETARSMDRLLCGDVGFGKTEVAIRAAFKCASQGKQVAVLAPTTLLVRQHLETFGTRMVDYPVRVEALSRFTSAKKAAEVFEGMQSGAVDVVIGTHRLLSEKSRFRDLGLLIIDEEQRFGVRHKEKLKRLRAEVDVLTLSATPIPRTLHMALVGLRDISTLREPPRGRQAVKTVVTYHDDSLVQKAIQRELAREGQVFYLYNRVRDIERVAARVMELVPRARVAIGHGQMTGPRLEKVAMAFQRGEVDVLVCTTIIESGIDIPRVNTLLVEHPELMGLADLHQLRGRIGRSDRQAYAYFLLPRKPLPSLALKRLRALEGLSHLGAGFDVAIRDLEIRGAGNLLGSQQSGHIEAVGYDLYCRLLAQAVAKRRGKKPPAEPEEIDVSLGVAAFLPREYVRSTHQRMGMVRRLGEARGEAAFAELEAELRDRFGRIPEPVTNLLKVFRLKDRCRRYGVARIFYPGTGEALLFVRDLKKFARAPLGQGEARWVEGRRVLLELPARVTTPVQVLDHVLARLDAADDEAAATRTASAGRDGKPGRRAGKAARKKGRRR